jgi:hypothetical protein
MTPFTPLLILTSLYEVFIEWMEYDDTFHTSAHCDLTDWSIYLVNGVWWHLSYLFSLWPHCMKYLLSEWSMMTPFIFLLIVTSLYEVFIGWMEYDDTFHTSAHCDLTDWNSYWVKGVWWHLSYLCSLWSHCIKYLLSEWSTMTLFTPLHIVTSPTEVFIEWMEYDDTFHTSAHCDLTDWSIYWVNGVWWHLSYLCTLWPHSLKYSLSEWSMMTPFTPLLIVTSLYEVFIAWMEYDDTFHTSAHCDLTDWSMYWVNGVWWHLSYLCSLWPHWLKYLLSEWSMMTPFTPLLIVTSLYEVFIEWMEYDDTFHTSAHCDLTVWNIYWVNGVWWHLSYLCSLWPHWLKYIFS